MPFSLRNIYAALLQSIADNIAARQALSEFKSELSLEELRELQRIRLEQDLARERIRLGLGLNRPFNGL